MSNRAALRRLRAGIVPLEQLMRLSVGFGAIRDLLAERLAILEEGKTSPPLFVRGEWGAGKSHLLSFLRAQAQARSLPVALVELNARSAPLNYPQRLYPIAAENLECGSNVTGLRGLVLSWLEDARLRSNLKNAAARSTLPQLAWSITGLVRRFEDGGNVADDDSGEWSVLLGAHLRWAAYGYKRDQALLQLEALAVFLQDLGYGGLVLLFDEAETIDQLANFRSRLTAYGVLGRLCRMKAVWCVFGITGRFDNTIASDLASGFGHSELVSPDGKWFLKQWSEGRFDLLKHPEVEPRLAHELARRVARLYREAYGTSNSDEGVADRCVDAWLKNPGRNPRRLIRLVVHQLDLRHPLEEERKSLK